MKTSVAINVVSYRPRNVPAGYQVVCLRLEPHAPKELCVVLSVFRGAVQRSKKLDTEQDGKDDNAKDKTTQDKAPRKLRVTKVFGSSIGPSCCALVHVVHLRPKSDTEFFASCVSPCSAVDPIGSVLYEMPFTHVEETRSKVVFTFDPAALAALADEEPKMPEVSAVAGRKIDVLVPVVSEPAA